MKTLLYLALCATLGAETLTVYNASATKVCAVYETSTLDFVQIVQPGQTKAFDCPASLKIVILKTTDGAVQTSFTGVTDVKHLAIWERADATVIEDLETVGTRWTPAVTEVMTDGTVPVTHIYGAMLAGLAVMVPLITLTALMIIGRRGERAVF